MTGRASRKPDSGPSNQELAGILGGAAALWDELRSEVGSGFGPVTERWTLSAKTGRWSLRLQQARTRRTVPRT